MSVSRRLTRHGSNLRFSRIEQVILLLFRQEYGFSISSKGNIALKERKKMTLGKDLFE
jgi:hypothetical protein